MIERPKGILSCHRLTKRFNGVCAVNEVTISFPLCGSVAIIGPNGAGKSTFLNVITGFSKADSGQVSLGDIDLLGLDSHQIVLLGIARTFQSIRLVLEVTCLENVMLASSRPSREGLFRSLLPGGRESEEDKSREQSLLHLKNIGLMGKANSLAGELSFGEQKLLSLTLCLATDPSILILDEPVAGVHPGMVTRIADFIRELRSTGKLVIFTEHDLTFVRELAEEVVFMDQGRILLRGCTNTVLNLPEVIATYVG